TFAARFPSSIFVTLTLIVLAAVLWNTTDPQRALWTTFLFATSGLTIAAAKMSITDGVLILFVTISQLCLYAIWRGRAGWPVIITFGLANGFGLLTKGPVVLGVMGMTCLALIALRWSDHPQQAGPLGPGDPDLKVRLGISKHPLAKSIVAILLMLAVVGPWLYAIEHRNPGYTWRTIRTEVLNRAATPQEGHKGPPGYYLLTIWLTFFPWCLLLPMTLLHAWRNRSSPQVRFALAAVIGPWIMFEIVATKLPHYLLPIFPALAFLTADALLRRGRPLKSIAMTGFAMFVVVAVLYALILPRTNWLRVSQRVADILIHQGATHEHDAIMIDYKEPSLAFYQGGTIREQRNNDYIHTTPPSGWPRWIVLTSEVWNQTPPPIKDQLQIIGDVKGLDYADGWRKIDVLVLRKR
ncbi:MAG TPA: phospholipid carrier-dependent glycosyltransferase, partial [Tepidisphaeraceae bacterium]|nr:phospholipid carrier-dependent glycosyltransferase [Tepidisphaeraceae bacterium]